MPKYWCPRCKYETDRRSNYLHHLHRKLACKALFSEESLESLIIRAETTTTTTGETVPTELPSSSLLTCIGCNHTFSSRQILDQHEIACSKARIEEMQKVMAEQTRRIRELEEEKEQQKHVTNVIFVENKNNNNNNNITINTTTNIIVNNFGSEDRSYVTHDVLQKCLDTMRINPLVDHIYFNPEHPENHTVKLKSEKRGRVIVWQGGDGWIEDDMMSSINTMIHKENSNLTKFFFEEVWTNPDIKFDNKVWTQTKLVKINDKGKDYFEQRRLIQVKLKNFTIATSS